MQPHIHDYGLLLTLKYGICTELPTNVQNIWQAISMSRHRATVSRGTKPLHTPVLCVMASRAEKVHISY